MRSRSNLRLGIFLGVLLVVTIAATFDLKYVRLTSNANGNGYSFTNLNIVSGTNGTFQTISGNATNQFAGRVNRFGSQVTAAGSDTNWFWDFGLTNTYGPVHYQSILAETNVCFLGITNCSLWSILSVNVLATGTNRLILFPTNLPHLNTNGLTLSGTFWKFTLTNGNEFRICLQSNSVTLSTLWTTFGQ